MEQQSCWITQTTPQTHAIIRDNLDKSPLYSGMIHGTGPRYCPSIEDKVVKFVKFAAKSSQVLTHCDQHTAPFRADIHTDGPTRESVSETSKSQLLVA